MPYFSEKSKRPETLDEIEEQTTMEESRLQYLKTLREEEEEKSAIALLKAKGQQWQDFSTNGKKSGFSLDKVKAWLRDHNY
jgi:hypothetical protein